MSSLGAVRLRSPRTIALLVSVIIIVIGIAFLSVQVYPNHNMKWSVSVGDTFGYEVSYDGGTTLDNWYDEFIQWAALDGQEVVFQVVALPEIPPAADFDSYLEKVVLTSKVTCRFLNGSAVPENFSQDLCNVVSWSICPANGCDVIDAWFADRDPYPSESGTERYYAYLPTDAEGTLTIGFEVMCFLPYGHDRSGHGWHSCVLTDSGHPLNITMWVANPSSSGYYLDSMTLSLLWCEPST